MADTVIGKAEIGKRLFRRFLELCPESRALFSFENPNLDLDTLMEEAKAQKHAEVMLATLAFCITKVNDMDYVQKKMSKLASRHAGYGVKPYMYKFLM